MKRFTINMPLTQYQLLLLFRYLPGRICASVSATMNHLKRPDISNRPMILFGNCRKVSLMLIASLYKLHACYLAKGVYSTEHNAYLRYAFKITLLPVHISIHGWPMV